MKKVILSIDGMTCAACSSGLEKYLNKQDGIKNASVNLVMSNASIEYDDSKINEDDLNRFVKEAGFKSLGRYILNFEEKQNIKRKYLLVFLVILEVLLLYIAMGHMFGLPQIPAIDISLNPFNYALVVCTLSSLAILCGFRIIKNGIKNLIHLTPNMDSLVTLGVITSYIYSFYETIQIAKGINVNHFAYNLYFESSAMVIFFIELGQYIESRNTNKTKEALKDLVSITPKKAVVLKEDDEKEVTIDEIQKGDLIICRPGEKIAVDGEVVEGETHVDEAFITGESIPVKKTHGSKVLAGSINYEGSIRYKAEKIGKESTVSEIVKMVVEATSEKVPIEKLADKICGIFVPIVLCISIIAFSAWLIFTDDLATSINVFVTILVAACPCSLGLATPLAIVVAMGICSKEGILIKNGATLENAYKVKNILFDKTGTLTCGKLQVTKMFNYSNENDEDILKAVASIEKKSEHPIAKAIVEFAKSHNVQLIACKDFKSISGQGIYAKIKEDEYYVGNIKLVEDVLSVSKNSVNDELIEQCMEDEKILSLQGNSVLYILKNGEIISMIGLRDSLRENTRSIIKNLQDKKIGTIMLTGDNEITASVVAKEIGIEKVYASCSPIDKANKVLEYKEKGIVMMCGDGINDSISLVNSDIGVAVSNGTDVSINSAGVVLMNDNLEKIERLMKISNSTIRIIRENLFWAFIYNIIMIPIACGIFKGWGIEINPMIGSAAMMVSSILVVLNSLRLKRIV